MLEREGLERFVEAQNHAGAYEDAVRELRAGKKETHWMWYVFPQIEGLGESAMAQRFAIRDLDEARSYLAHDILGPRLKEATTITLQHKDKTLKDIFWEPDDLKFCSSMTLFEAAGVGDLFTGALEAFCGGERDAATLERIGKKR